MNQKVYNYNLIGKKPRLETAELLSKQDNRRKRFETDSSEFLAFWEKDMLWILSQVPIP